MADKELHGLANAWVALQYAKEESAEHNQNFWAYERLEKLRRQDPEACWDVIHVIRKLDGSDLILSNLAAGPLEDLLVQHGGDFIDRVEELAAQDEQFRKILGAVWKNEMNESVWQRVREAADSSW